jgi:hypothetical protein
MMEVRLFWDYKQMGTEHNLCVEKEQNGKKTGRLEARYEAEPTAVSEIRIDASSPVGLFRYLRQTISEAENERLERCLSDLLLCQLHSHLHEPDATILIEGPPISKLIGRIGYRYPKPEITIAFVTIDEKFFSPPRHPPAVRDPSDSWDGPFPDQQQESLTRCYYSTLKPRLRVDFFTQALTRLSTAVQEGPSSLGLAVMLQRYAPAINEFAATLRQRHEPVGIPPAKPGENSRLPFSDYRAIQPLAARGAHASPTSAENPGMHAPTASPTPKKALDLSNSEVFAAIFGEANSKTARSRLEALVKFASETGLGPLAENIPFLRFVFSTIDSGSYGRSRVFSPTDLSRWFREFHDGMPAGSTS